MAVTYPGARWTPLGAETQTRLANHDVICVHTMVGYLVSTDTFFRHTNGEAYAGTESHFGVGGRWGPDLGGGLDGAVWQWQDLDYRADANLDGNSYVISIETADNAARPIAPWTEAQMTALVDLIAWLCARYSIPPTLIPDTKPGRRGLAYHAQGAAERVPGGVAWSTSPGKDCPTAPRIAQFKTTVIPRVQATLRGEEIDMPLTDADFARIRQEVITALNDPTHQYLQDELAPLKAGLKAVTDGQAQLAEAVAALARPAAVGDLEVSGTLHFDGSKP